MLKPSFKRDLVKVPSLRIVEMHGAGQARIKGMNGAKNLDRLLDVCHGCADERLLERRALLLGVTRRTIPGSGHHKLVVIDLFVVRSEEHTSELQSLRHLVCRLL